MHDILATTGAHLLEPDLREFLAALAADFNKTTSRPFRPPTHWRASFSLLLVGLLLGGVGGWFAHSAPVGKAEPTGDNRCNDGEPDTGWTPSDCDVTYLDGLLNWCEDTYGPESQTCSDIGSILDAVRSLTTDCRSLPKEKARELRGHIETAVVNFRRQMMADNKSLFERARKCASAYAKCCPDQVLTDSPKPNPTDGSSINSADVPVTDPPRPRGASNLHPTRYPKSPKQPPVLPQPIERQIAKILNRACKKYIIHDGDSTPLRVTENPDGTVTLSLDNKEVSPLNLCIREELKKAGTFTAPRPTDGWTEIDVDLSLRREDSAR